MKKKLIKALNVIREESPTFYDEIINGVCPHDAGLTDANEEQCGFNDPTRAFVMGFCGECWAAALGDER